ncbi:hypothetical protein TURTL08_05740 [Turicimonas sp. TL08]
MCRTRTTLLSFGGTFELTINMSPCLMPEEKALSSGAEQIKEERGSWINNLFKSNEVFSEKDG